MRCLPANLRRKFNQRQLPGRFQIAAGQSGFLELLHRIAQDIQQLRSGQILDARLLDFINPKSDTQNMTDAVQRVIAPQIRRSRHGIVPHSRIEIMQRQPNGAIGDAQERLLLGGLFKASAYRLFVERQLPNLFEQMDLMSRFPWKSSKVIETGGSLDRALVMAQNGFRQADEKVKSNP